MPGKTSPERRRRIAIERDARRILRDAHRGFYEVLMHARRSTEPILAAPYSARIADEQDRAANRARQWALDGMADVFPHEFDEIVREALEDDADGKVAPEP